MINVLLIACIKNHKPNEHNVNFIDSIQEPNLELLEDSTKLITIGSSRLDSIVIFQKKVLKNGDIASYEELRIIALDIPPHAFFFWAFTMANKYNYGPAYTDVYKCLLDANGCDLDMLDKKTKDFALSYLRMGAKIGDSEAKEILELIDLLVTPTVENPE